MEPVDETGRVFVLEADDRRVGKIVGEAFHWPATNTWSPIVAFRVGIRPAGVNGNRGPRSPMFPQADRAVARALPTPCRLPERTRRSQRQCVGVTGSAGSGVPGGLSFRYHNCGKRRGVGQISSSVLPS